MPYVMIPAFPPGHQPLPVTPESQMALPIQPIPCKPGTSKPRNVWDYGVMQLRLSVLFGSVFFEGWMIH